MGDSKTLISANELRDLNIIGTNSDNKGSWGDSHFCTYRSRDTAEAILKDNGNEGNYFFLNSIAGTNDIHEKELHANSENVFPLCFCHSDTENIPLWFLYGGIDGHGICIRLTVNKMKDFLGRIKSAYPVNENGKIDTKTTLNKGTDFELSAGWVYYCKEEQNKQNGENETIVKYRGNAYKLSDESLTLFQKDNYFIKDYPWYYEKEFRILFIFKEKPSERIAVPLPKSKFEIDGGLSIKLAPNYTEQEEEELRKTLNDSKLKIQKSKLSISFELFSRNENPIFRYLVEAARNSENEKTNEKFHEICRELQKRNNCWK